MRKTKTQHLHDEVVRLGTELARTREMARQAHEAEIESLGKCRVAEGAIADLSRRLEVSERRVTQLLHILQGQVYPPQLTMPDRITDFEAFKRAGR